MSPRQRGRPLADPGLTAGQVTARARGALEQPPPRPGETAVGPACVAETWPRGWGGRRRTRRSPPARDSWRAAWPFPPGSRALCFPGPRPPLQGDAERGRPRRQELAQARRRSLPRRPRPAGRGRRPVLAPRAAAGARAGVAPRRRERWEGAGSPGSRWSRSACAGRLPPRLLVLWRWLPGWEARPSPATAGTPPLSVNKLLCGGASVVPGRVCACLCG